MPPTPIASSSRNVPMISPGRGNTTGGGGRRRRAPRPPRTAARRAHDRRRGRRQPPFSLLLLTSRVRDLALVRSCHIGDLHRLELAELGGHPEEETSVQNKLGSRRMR